MPLLLPNLDDRTWADLADEGRALIPVYGPEWTDHNASDPGITLVELLAWKTEMDIYRLNQVSDEQRLRFLDLVGVKPKGPQPACAVLSFVAKNGTPTLPKSLEFSGLDANQVESRYQTLREISLAPGSLTALQSAGPAGFQNLTSAWKRRSSILPLGANPQVGAAFYLGLSDPPPANFPVSMYFTFGDGFSGWTYREQMRAQLHQQSRCRCHKIENACCGSKKIASNGKPAETAGGSPEILVHHGVRTIWEYLTISGGVQSWAPLNSATKQVVDETCSFTLDGAITVRVPVTLPRVQIGAVGSPLCYLRCRVDAGRYDAAPVLADAAFNAVPTVQKISAISTFVVATNCAITYAPGGAPKPIDQTALRITFDTTQRIIQLDFTSHAPTDPQFTILDFLAPKDGKAGCLSFDAAFLGFGNGLPVQQVTLLNAPVDLKSVYIYTQERNFWHGWDLRQDFLASTRRDGHVVLDTTTGIATFGNGEHGRVPPLHAKKNSTEPNECLMFGKFEATRAQEGKLGANAINALTNSLHNRALLSNQGANPNGWSTLQVQLGGISNPLPSSSGNAAETLSLAAGRADQLVDSSGRAVTLSDYEQFALATPGARIARVKALANLHPDFPCYVAPGMITVIVLPFLPQGQPTPTQGLIQSVTRQLQSRRVIGTRVEVVGPTYLEVAVQATVQSKNGVDKVALQTNVISALNAFLDPLAGGPEKTGWPFGRDVYRAEILKILSEVIGVDHVTTLALIPAEGPAQCGNVCLGQTWLVAPGAHQIGVL
jgi:Baseplate J-like protein